MNPDEQTRRDALSLVRGLAADAMTREMTEPHGVVEHDPETGLYQVFGPYPDGYTAQAVAAQRQQWHETHTGPPAITVAIAKFYDADEGTMP